MSNKQQDSTCPIDCLSAKTPAEECECSCNGDNHGCQDRMFDFAENEPSNSETKVYKDEVPETEQTSFDDFSWDEDGVVECVNCEKLMVVTDRDCCATSLGTPISRYYGFDDVDFDDRYDWIPICSDCYDRGSEQIAKGD